MKTLLLILALNISLIFSVQASPIKSSPKEIERIVQKYADMVYKDYQRTYQDALAMQKAIHTLLASPNQKQLTNAKQAWLVARSSYGQTEAFRFYEGPIDYVDENGNEGPEGRLNAWPLDEAYIDYVQGQPKAGIVNDPKVTITKATLAAKNQADDEVEVATGYHAIEFLLWGQDLSLNGPGQRPVSDFANTPKNQRRRDYLKVVVALLLDDLKFLVDEWTPNKNNYAKSFLQNEAALSKIMTALATLSGFELASERMATVLDSNDQEDEHSCFSDNTHNDYIYNAQGIFNVFFNTGIYEYLKQKDQDLAKTIKQQLLTTKKQIAALPKPIDREILSSPQNSKARRDMEAAIKSLQTQADLFKKTGPALGIQVSINE